jgi:hypothetical protein
MKTPNETNEEVARIRAACNYAVAKLRVDAARGVWAACNAAVAKLKADAARDVWAAKERARKVRVPAWLIKEQNRLAKMRAKIAKSNDRLNEPDPGLDLCKATIAAYAAGGAK